MKGFAPESGFEKKGQSRVLFSSLSICYANADNTNKRHKLEVCNLILDRISFGGVKELQEIFDE